MLSPGVDKGWPGMSVKTLCIQFYQCNLGSLSLFMYTSKANPDEHA